MTDFVEMHRADGAPDYVNRELVSRVQAVMVSNTDWVVKVLLADGTEVVDGHTAGSREEADARIAAIVNPAGVFPPPAGLSPGGPVEGSGPATSA